MTLFEVLSATLVTAAFLAWINHRFVRLPTTIGVMIIALVMSLGLQGMHALGLPVLDVVNAMLAEIDFSHALLDVMLAFLLFAGALHVQIEDLVGQKWVIGTLATVGVIVSTFLVGGMTWLLAGAFDVEIPFLHALLFGALISPTDPIAVMGILKRAGAPKSLETKIAGESLFNDGIGVVVFQVLVGLAVAGLAAGGGADQGAAAGHDAGHALDAAGIASLFAMEVAGAVVLGLVFGWLTYAMLKSVDNYEVEVLLTLALCVGVYSLAMALHSSGPLAVVVAGLFIGNRGRRLAMSQQTTEHVDTFWKLVDEILNVVLFVLIGMELLVVFHDVEGIGYEMAGTFLLMGVIAIPLVLLARFLAVGGTISALRHRRDFTPRAVQVMTWGGLRGGISVALALSLPVELASRELVLVMTYVVVIFSIVVQGLSIGKLVATIPRPDPSDELPAH